MDKVMFVAWTRFDRRSELLAERLDADLRFIHCGRRGRVLQAPVRYLRQAVRTWHVLTQDRPRIVFVQNPPIFCAMVAFLYGRVYGARYVIDSHTSAFLSPKWRPFLGLHRMLSRAAQATIVHNEAQEKLVRAWGCRYCVLPDPVGGYPEGKQFGLDEGPNAVIVSTYEDDEPLEMVFEAAGMLPEVSFYVTGDPDRADLRRIVARPGNCHLTGFLPYDVYIGLLREADVVVDLTTRDDTLLCGAFEAVSLGKPLVVSDWPILRRSFPSGTVYVPNTADGISQGIRQACRDQALLRRDILRLREQLSLAWDDRFRELTELIHRA